MLNQSSQHRKRTESKKTTIDHTSFFCPGRICQFTWLLSITREITWILHVTCEFIFCLGKFALQCTLFMPFLSTYSYVQKSTYPYPKYISHIHTICPVTSERYSEVTGHLPGDRQTNADAIISSDHFSSLHHQSPTPITHRTIILTLLPSVHRRGLVCTVSS